MVSGNGCDYRYIIYVHDLEEFAKYVDKTKPVTVGLVHENDLVYVEVRGIMRNREDTLIAIRSRAIALLIMFEKDEKVRNQVLDLLNKAVMKIREKVGIEPIRGLIDLIRQN